MSFGRGKLLQSMKEQFCGDVDDLQHQLYMACTSDYTNESIENFCHQLADRYGSNQTSEQRFGEGPEFRSGQFDDGVVNGDRKPEVSYQKSYAGSSPSNYSKKRGSNKVQNSFMKSFNSPDGAEGTSRPLNTHGVDKKSSPRHWRNKAAKSYLPPISPQSEIDDSYVVHTDETQPKTLNKRTNGDTSPIKCSQTLRSNGGEVSSFKPFNKLHCGGVDESPTRPHSARRVDKTSSRRRRKKSSNLPVNLNLEASTSDYNDESIGKNSYQLAESDAYGPDSSGVKNPSGSRDLKSIEHKTDNTQFEDSETTDGNDFLELDKDQNSCVGPASSTRMNSGKTLNANDSNAKNDGIQHKPEATSKGMGRGQSLKMVMSSIPSAVIDAQQEISMGCDPSYTNQSIENVLERIRIKYDEEGFY